MNILNMFASFKYMIPPKEGGREGGREGGEHAALVYIMFYKQYLRVK